MLHDELKLRPLSPARLRLVLDLDLFFIIPLRLGSRSLLGPFTLHGGRNAVAISRHLTFTRSCLGSSIVSAPLLRRAVEGVASFDGLELWLELALQGADLLAKTTCVAAGGVWGILVCVSDCSRR
jgi:hypothetical protein